jgi:hypothetical protein
MQFRSATGLTTDSIKQDDLSRSPECVYIVTTNLQLLHVHHIIGRPCLARGHPRVDLGFELGVCYKFFVFQATTLET